MSLKALFVTPTMLAPMAGYTDSAFRSIAKNFGCGMTVTEMVSSMALCQGNLQTRELLARQPNDNNCAVQIFGHDPAVMAESVEILKQYNFAAIDINMGCPVRKIISNGDGSALLENPKLAGKIVRAVADRLDIPLSVKIRTGVDNSDGAANFAKTLQDSGADFLTVHLRTRKQLYSGSADYSVLPKIVAAVKIPVVANGDIDSRQKMLEALDMGATAVAVGRASLGNPQIFSQLLNTKCNLDLLDTIKQHISLANSTKSQRVVAAEMKKHLAYYLKGIRGAKAVIVELMTTSTVDQQLEIVTNFLNSN